MSAVQWWPVGICLLQLVVYKLDLTDAVCYYAVYYYSITCYQQQSDSDLDFERENWKNKFPVCDACREMLLIVKKNRSYCWLFPCLRKWPGKVFLLQTSPSLDLITCALSNFQSFLTFSHTHAVTENQWHWFMQHIATQQCRDFGTLIIRSRSQEKQLRTFSLNSAVIVCACKVASIRS